MLNQRHQILWSNPKWWSRQPKWWSRRCITNIDLISRIVVVPMLPDNMVASTKNRNPQNHRSLLYHRYYLHSIDNSPRSFAIRTVAIFWLAKRKMDDTKKSSEQSIQDLGHPHQTENFGSPRYRKLNVNSKRKLRPYYGRQSHILIESSSQIVRN